MCMFQGGADGTPGSEELIDLLSFVRDGKGRLLGRGGGPRTTEERPEVSPASFVKLSAPTSYS